MESALIFLALWAAPTGRDVPPFALSDGDRVAFLGDATFEEMARRNDLELRLTARFPDAHVRFRNFGYAGDTVFGDALAGFDTATQGYERRLKLIQEFGPTVVIAAFGANESWAGEKGLEAFTQGYERLVDDLTKLNPREVVLVGPMQQENLGPPYPDPTAHNADVRRYVRVIKEISRERGHRFVDFDDPDEDGPAIAAYPVTDDGLHLSDEGQRMKALLIEATLLESKPPVADQSIVLKQAAATGSSVTAHAEATLATLPLPVPFPRRRTPTLVFGKVFVDPIRLDPGEYTLKIDGLSVARSTHEEWHRGVAIEKGPDHDQVEELRKVIAAKNRLVFDRNRPANDVYLFGFRKHEQGNNAAEIPQFDPLIAEKEAEIARLRKPRPHTYELVREEKSK